jgi:hypothetical protein
MEQQKKHKSHKWLWITLSIVLAVGAILVASYLKSASEDKAYQKRFDMVESMGDFISSKDFADYKAVQDYLKANNAEIIPGSFVDSDFDSADYGKTDTYPLVISQSPTKGGDSVKYVKLTVTAKDDGSHKLNLKKFTKNSDFNEWFTITKISFDGTKFDKINKGLAAETDASSSSAASSASSRAAYSSSLARASEGTSFYRAIRDYWQIPDAEKNTLIKDDDTTSSEKNTQLDNVLSDLSSGLPKNDSENNLFNVIVTALDNQVGDNNLDSYKYYEAKLIADNYYGIILETNSNGSGDNVLLVIHDDNGKAKDFHNPTVVYSNVVKDFKIN